MPVFVRKKPVVVAAMHYEGWNRDNVLRWINGIGGVASAVDGNIIIETLEGRMAANSGDWVICGVKNEFYPVKPDIFEATYDITDDVKGPEPL